MERRPNSALRSLRKRAKLTQAELATEAEVGRVTIARAEAGSDLRSSTAAKIADVLARYLVLRPRDVLDEISRR